jgi:hypothetical protein
MKQAPADPARDLDFARLMAWLADAREAQGRLAEALRDRRAEVAIYDRILARSPKDNLANRSLVTARRNIGQLHLAGGDIGSALDAALASADLADRLLALEPDNTDWLEVAALAHADVADILFAARRPEAAAAHVHRVEQIASALAARDKSVLFWTGFLKHRALGLRAEVEATRNRPAEALQLATLTADGLGKAYAGKRVEPDATWLGARAHLLAGEQHRRLGAIEAARREWASLAAATDGPGRGSDLRLRALRAIALQRLGRTTEANAIASDLRRTSYREPAFSAAFPFPSDRTIRR